MVTKSKLRLALAAEKGIDFTKLKQQKKNKEAAKRKALQAGSIEGGSEDEGALDQSGETAADNEIEEDQEKVSIETPSGGHFFPY
jgi:rRNA-processing protein EBP2